MYKYSFLKKKSMLKNNIFLQYVKLSSKKLRSDELLAETF